MTETRQFVLSLPTDLIKRVDLYARQMESEFGPAMPEVAFDGTNAVRVLLERGLTLERGDFTKWVLLYKAIESHLECDTDRSGWTLYGADVTALKKMAATELVNVAIHGDAYLSLSDCMARCGQLLEQRQRLEASGGTT